MTRCGFALLLLAGACVQERRPTTHVDAGIDAPPADVPPPCTGADSEFHLQFVDIDSTDAQPMPIAGVQVYYSFDPTVGTTTDANGEVSLTLSDCPHYLVVVGPGEYLSGDLAMESPNTSGRPIRMMTAARAASLYASLGLTFNTARGQILALDVGDRRPFSVTPDHGPIWHADDSAGTLTWEPGAGGRYAVIPNIDTTPAPATLTESASPDPVRAHDVRVGPGELSLVVFRAVID